MKKTALRFSLLFATLFTLQTSSFAQHDKEEKHEKNKYEFEKKKSINKSYSVSASDKLDLQNSFGSVTINTWSKNEIKVDVNIEVSATTDALAQKIIDGISIADKQSSGVVSFKTSIKGAENNSKNEKSSMAVNYTVSMPATNALKLSNEFGATIVPDMKGEVDLNSKFGSLTTGNLANVKDINVEFGKATFGSLANADVSVKYSKATFDKLSGNIKLNIEFSGASKIILDNNVTALDVKASYSKVNIQPVGDPSASYTINTSFGDMKNNSNVKFEGGDDKNEHGPNFDKKYTGKSGSGSIPVKVNSSFGKVIIGEASADDMKDKDKNKEKSKLKTGTV